MTEAVSAPSARIASNGRAASAAVSRLAPGSLTVFLPVHNEADTIAGVVDAFYSQVILPTSASLLICEDGSSDGSGEVLDQLAARYPMRLERAGMRKGYADAVRNGLERVETPIIFFADSDGQYYPEDFWKLLPYAQDYDMVIGRKVNRDEPFHRIALSKGFHVLAKALTAVPLQDMDCGFRLLRREIVDEILPEVGSLPYSFWAEFTILAYRRGLRIIEIPVSHRSRPNGTTSIYRWERLPHIVSRQFLGLTALSRRLRTNATVGSR